MIKARHHPFFVWFFRQYAKLMIQSHFRKVFVEGNKEKSESAIIIVSNHFSWWDGFFINYLNHRLWQKKFHAMMLEEQLDRRKFLSWTGCFSIRLNHPSAIQSLRYAREILQHPGNMLLMYPQGKIYSQHERPLHFEPGAEHLARITNAKIKMVVVLIDYFSFKKPSVWFYIKDYIPEKRQPETLNEAFNKFLEECIESQNKKAD